MPPSAGGSSSPAPSGTPSGPDQSGSCSCVRRPHTCVAENHEAAVAFRFWPLVEESTSQLHCERSEPFSEVFEAQSQLIVVPVQLGVAGNLGQEHLSHLQRTLWTRREPISTARSLEHQRRGGLFPVGPG